MKSQFVRTVLTAGLAMLGGLTLSAQNPSAIAKIPFAYQANHASLAAGKYTVERANVSGLFQLTDQSTGKSIFVNAPSMIEAKGHSEGHLSFACYQGDCVLSQIWLPGSDVGYARSDASVNSDMQRKLSMATMISVRLAH
jgi:hypothetical protein